MVHRTSQSDNAVGSKRLRSGRVKILMTFPVMKLPYLGLFKLCYTDFKTVCSSPETKQN